MKLKLFFKNNLPIINSNRIKFIIFLHLYNIQQINEWIELINKFITLNSHSSIKIFINIPIDNHTHSNKINIDLQDNYDIYDLQSCINENNIHHIKNIINQFNSSFIKPTFIVSHNKGVDIGGFFHFLTIIKDHSFDYIFKLHTKSDTRWRQKLSKILTKQYTHDYLSYFDLISTMIFKYPAYKYDFETNNFHINNLCKKHNIKYNSTFRFIPGTIFIGSKKFIDVLLQLNINNIYNELNDHNTTDINWINMMNNNEIFQHHVVYNKINSSSKEYINHGHNFKLMSLNITGIRDGMIEHAWERIFGLIAENIGGHIKQIYI